MQRSTRLAIVQGALEDALARLDDLAPSAGTRSLRVRALTYQQALARWELAPPNAEQRAALMSVVLDLHAEVMRIARAGSTEAT